MSHTSEVLHVDQILGKSASDDCAFEISNNFWDFIMTVRCLAVISFHCWRNLNFLSRKSNLDTDNLINRKLCMTSDSERQQSILCRHHYFKFRCDGTVKLIAATNLSGYMYLYMFALSCRAGCTTSLIFSYTTNGLCFVLINLQILKMISFTQ